MAEKTLTEQGIWENLTPIQKNIHNTRFCIESAQQAIQILKDGKSAFIPQLVLERYVKEHNQFLSELLAEEERGAGL